MSKFEYFYSSTSFSIDLGCPLLRGSSVRRLRRYAAPHPFSWERTFPSPVFVSSCAEGTAVVNGLVGEKKFSRARHWNKTCCHRSSCETSPSCRKCLHSLGVSISVTVPKAPVTAGYNCRHCHPLFGLPPPLLPGCSLDWAAGSHQSSSVERLGAAVRISMALLVRWSHH